MVQKFDKYMFPILDWLKDGSIRTNKEAQERMVEHFQHTEEDLNEQTPRGGSRFKGNVNWALTFLFQAGLTSKPKNGKHQISEKGLQYLSEGINDISERELVQRFGDTNPRFFYPNRDRQQVAQEDSGDPIMPEDAIHDAAKVLEEALIAELLDRVKQISPQDFEKLVVKLLVKMGYGGSIEDAASVTRYTNDEGIDGVIKEDILGLDSIYIQAKRYTTGSVGRPELQTFVGALSPHHAKKGVFITTSEFAQTAKDFAKAAEARIILIDGRQLCKYMIQFNLGVSTRETIEIKSIDTDFFNFD